MKTSLFGPIMFCSLMTSSIIFAGIACTKQQSTVVAPAVAPTSSCVTKIVADALSGMSRADILKDVGLECATSIAEIDNVLNGSAAPLPAVKRSAAYLEMHGAP